MDARHRDNAFSRVKFCLRQRGPAVEAQQRVATADFLSQKFLVDFRMKRPKPEFREAMLDGEFFDDAYEKIDAAVAAGITRRTDNHRYTQSAGREQHLLEVMPLPCLRAGTDIGPE